MANKLDLADAQLLGYAHAKKGYGLSDLVESMGLKKLEWLKLRTDYHVTLKEDDIEEIDRHFGVYEILRKPL